MREHDGIHAESADPGSGFGDDERRLHDGCPAAPSPHEQHFVGSPKRVRVSCSATRTVSSSSTISSRVGRAVPHRGGRARSAVRGASGSPPVTGWSDLGGRDVLVQQVLGRHEMAGGAEPEQHPAHRQRVLDQPGAAPARQLGRAGTAAPPSGRYSSSTVGSAPPCVPRAVPGRRRGTRRPVRTRAVPPLLPDDACPVDRRA